MLTTRDNAWLFAAPARTALPLGTPAAWSGYFFPWSKKIRSMETCISMNFTQSCWRSEAVRRTVHAARIVWYSVVIVSSFHVHDTATSNVTPWIQLPCNAGTRVYGLVPGPRQCWYQGVWSVAAALQLLCDACGAAGHDVLDAVRRAFPIP